MQFSSTSQMAFLKKINKLIQNLYGNVMLKSLEKENKAGRFILLNLKTYYKSIVIQVVWHWYEDKHI